MYVECEIVWEFFKVLNVIWALGICDTEKVELLNKV